MADLDGAGDDLDRWLEPFLGELGHKRRRTWAPLYLRGLMGPGERKSLQPMAARLGLSGHDQLQHFIASPAWMTARCGGCWPSARIGSDVRRQPFRA
jgi:DDE superfamily endonuclease